MKLYCGVFFFIKNNSNTSYKWCQLLYFFNLGLFWVKLALLFFLWSFTGKKSSYSACSAKCRELNTSTDSFTHARETGQTDKWQQTQYDWSLRPSNLKLWVCADLHSTYTSYLYHAIKECKDRAKSREKKNNRNTEKHIETDYEETEVASDGRMKRDRVEKKMSEWERVRVNRVRSGWRRSGASIHHAALPLSDASNRWGEIERRADTPLQSISTRYLGSPVRSAPSPQTKTITGTRGEGYSYTQTTRAQTETPTHGQTQNSC